MAKVKLTKTELKAQTDALKRFLRFLPMLQLKKQQLQGEIAGIVAKAEAVTAKEKAVDNEKYAFRCFLLRLGFIGAEFKTERKILLRNLTGSSAFRSGQPKEVEVCE